MSSDDPFADHGETESTVIRPSPGGRRAAERLRAAQPTAPPLARMPGINPLVTEASPLLGLINRIRNTVRHDDVDQLRQLVIQEIKQFTRRAIAAGIEPKVVGAGQYALCATVDDVVQNTPWGSASNWSRRGMVTTFHREAWGGDRFYTLLDYMQRDQERNQPALELMYLCLALGFEGRLRVLPNGASELARIRDALHRLIRRRRGDYERALSPHWMGVTTTRRGTKAVVPLWVAALIGLAIAAIVYLGLRFWLNTDSDGTFRDLFRLPPQGEVTLVRPERTEPAPAQSALDTAAATPPPPGNYDILNDFLRPQPGGPIELLGDNQRVIVRIGTDGMFGSGSATIAESFEPTLGEVAGGLEKVTGTIRVIGHTDNVPISNLRFASNVELSEARAEAVVQVLSRFMDGTELEAIGLADADPVVDCSARSCTASELAKNRRVDIEVVAPR
ncbi:MAG: type IVB secretion system protein IcmH/DotU [Alphaproteobacteria bacterium]